LMSNHLHNIGTPIMLHKCRALRAVYVSMTQAVDMYYVKNL